MNFEKGLEAATMMELASLGKIDGISAIHKFGSNPDIDTAATEDVWAYGGTKTYSSNSGVTLYISSSSSSDTQEVTVFGLDASFLEQEATVTLSGQTKTAISGTWTRLNKVFNSNSVNLVGNVYVYEDDTVVSGVPQTATKVKAYMSSSIQQTQQSHFTIPANKVGFLMRQRVSLTKSLASTAEVEFQARVFGGVFLPVNIVSVSEGSNSIIQHLTYEVLPPKTDVKYVATVSTNNTQIYCDYEIFLVPKNKVSELLSNIGAI